MMLKVYSKKTISAILASSLVFGLGTAVVNASPNTNNSVTTGRTEQNVGTGVIMPDKIPTLAHYATGVTLTGTVVIDGPQLVLTVNGAPVNAKLTKVADKTWTYQYTTSVGNQTGDVTFNIGAYTIYTNGKPAGQKHTTATAHGQTVHVPFVKSYDYTNLNWTGYDRTNNEFTFSYNPVKVWDDGVREEVTDLVNASVSGTETYQNTQNQGFTITPPVVVQSFAATEGTFSNYNRTNNTFDLTFDLTKHLSNGTSETKTISESTVDASKDYVYTASSEEPFAYSQNFTFTPPTVFRDFTFSADSPVWTYDATNNTYSVSFTVNETWSNGATATETIIRDGLTPGVSSEVSATIEGVTHSTSLSAPAVPIPSSVTGTVVASSIQSIWTGSDANGGNVKESYTLTYTINGTLYTVAIPNFTFNPGTGFNDQNLTYTVSYNGQPVLVNYTLPYIQPASLKENTSTSSRD